MAGITTVRKTIRLHPVQDAFCRSQAPVRGFLGGRGSGKSFAGCLDMIRRAKRDRLYLVVAPTYSMLQDATFRTFLDVGRSFNVIASQSVKASAPPSVRLTTGAEIIFRSADNPDRLRGPNYSGCLMDEGAQVGREVYEIVVAALRQGGERGWLSVTTTPRGLSNWVYEVFGEPGPDVETFHAATRQNPFLPLGFEHDIRLQYGNNLRAEQELAGRFVNVTGAEWDADYFLPSIWFTDWPHPSTIVRSVMAVDGSKGKLKGDWQALVLLRLDKEGHFWVDAEAVKLDPDRLLQKALSLIEQWQPDITVVETNSAGFYLLDQISKACVRGLRPAVVGRHHGSDSNKVARILTRMTSQWARGTIHLRRGSPGTRMLVEQARDFPEGNFDDLLDAWEMGAELLGQLMMPKDRRLVHYEIPRC